MKSVSPDLFGTAPWALLLVPLLWMLLSFVPHYAGRVRGSGPGLVTVAMAIFGTLLLSRWQDFL